MVSPGAAAATAALMVVEHQGSFCRLTHKVAAEAAVSAPQQRNVARTASIREGRCVVCPVAIFLEVCDMVCSRKFVRYSEKRVAQSLNSAAPYVPMRQGPAGSGAPVDRCQLKFVSEFASHVKHGARG